MKMEECAKIVNKMVKERIKSYKDEKETEYTLNYNQYKNKYTLYYVRKNEKNWNCAAIDPEICAAVERGEKV